MDIRKIGWMDGFTEGMVNEWDGWFVIGVDELDVVDVVRGKNGWCSTHSVFFEY